MADSIYGVTGVQNNANGTTAPMRLGRQADQMTSQLHVPGYEQAYRGNSFYSLSTAQLLSVVGTALTGNIIWNGSAAVNLVLIKANLQVNVTSATMTGIGLSMTTAGAQTTTPTGVTVATSTGSTFYGGVGSAATAYNAATTLVTVTRAALMHNTAAIAVTGVDLIEVPLNGWIIPPWTAVALSALGAASAAAAVTSTIYWEEVPV